ncbi:zinc-dependent alcohol dehydrogenase family protein [Dyella telluris]|uniref:Zinc-dependent alcohol dehydrogenase family protein n=1 Tax=Dyella telluris TaxID=2763498 RepID=A0A7G8Q5R2_9GAMM|nr:zinc-dependent alcohol dehydrogenase family protein [Dyella telluris]QNK02120.1 zinc-dependent alcohol dehydrogenase family protein [Dyella telluris]
MNAVPSMQAALLTQHDDAFQVANVPRPVPGRGQVLVRVGASAVNPLDLKIRAGKAGHAAQPLPAILGIDMAGVVESVGPGVSDFRPGDEVYGMTGGVGGVPGSLAQYQAADARLLAPRPSGIGVPEAAAMPLVYITAWEGLVDRAQVKAGQTVLVQGAGGVGHAVIQLARAFGATVFAVDGASKAEQIRGWGAAPIDRDTPVEQYVAEHTGGRGFDLVYDTVGGSGIDASFNAVKRFGHVVSALGWGTHALAPLSFRAGTYSGVFTLLPLLTGEGREHHGHILRNVARLADEGKITPFVDPRRFDLASVADAYALIERREARGKVVVEVAP